MINLIFPRAKNEKKEKKNTKTFSGSTFQQLDRRADGLQDNFDFVHADMQLRRRRYRSRPNNKQDERQQRVYRPRRRGFPALPHFLWNRDPKRPTVRAVGPRVPEKSDSLESRAQHLRRAEQPRVPRYENHDRGEGIAQVREMRSLSA